MKIKYKTRAAGPDGIRVPGDIADLPEEQARRLVAGGYAVTVEQARKPDAKPEQQETPKRKAGKK